MATNAQSFLRGIRRRSQLVSGYHLPSPRPTRWAFYYAAIYLGLPLIGVPLLLDVALYWVFAWVFDRCYGIACLF